MSKVQPGCHPFAVVKGEEVIAWGFSCSMPLRIQLPQERRVPKSKLPIPPFRRTAEGEET